MNTETLRRVVAVIGVRPRTGLFRTLNAFFLLSCLPLIGHAQQGFGVDTDIKRVVDSMVTPFLAQQQAPGAIVAVSIHGKRSYFTYGTATDGGQLFTPTTVVEIGSCTKVFTTTPFALAINRHQIDPDAPAQRYMQRGFKLQAQAQQMTPRELAVFTSGMPDNPPDAPKRLEMRSIDRYTTKDFLHWVSQWKPDGPIPAPYQYSNAGTGLLGYLVAEAAHISWEPMLNQEIIAPLAMSDTEMRPNGEQMSRMAQGHRTNGSPAPAWPINAWYAAGSLRSTAVDMLNFGEANLFHSTVAGRSVPSDLTAAMQLAQQPVYVLPREDAKQGMAWVTNLGAGDSNLAPEVLKNGGTVGFSTVILTNRRKDSAIFIAINKQGSNPAPLAVKLGRHLP